MRRWVQFGALAAGYGGLSWLLHAAFGREALGLFTAVSVGILVVLVWVRADGTGFDRRAALTIPFPLTGLVVVPLAVWRFCSLRDAYWEGTTYPERVGFLWSLAMLFGGLAILGGITLRRDDEVTFVVPERVDGRELQVHVLRTRWNSTWVGDRWSVDLVRDVGTARPGIDAFPRRARAVWVFEIPGWGPIGPRPSGPGPPRLVRATFTEGVFTSPVTEGVGVVFEPRGRLLSWEALDADGDVVVEAPRRPGVRSEVSAEGEHVGETASARPKAEPGGARLEERDA